MIGDVNACWWPVESATHMPTRRPLRAGEFCYAALGPMITHHLVDFCDRAIGHGVPVDPRVVGLIAELRMVDGQRPDMLVLLAVAAAAVRERALVIERPESVDNLFDTAALDETYKLFGSYVLEAAEQFGFDVETLTEYIKLHWNHYTEGQWPPSGLNYSTTPPTPVPSPPSPSRSATGSLLKDEPSLRFAVAWQVLAELANRHPAGLNFFVEHHHMGWPMPSIRVAENAVLLNPITDPVAIFEGSLTVLPELWNQVDANGIQAGISLIEARLGLHQSGPLASLGAQEACMKVVAAFARRLLFQQLGDAVIFVANPPAYAFEDDPLANLQRRWPGLEGPADRLWQLDDGHRQCIVSIDGSGWTRRGERLDLVDLVRVQGANAALTALMD